MAYIKIKRGDITIGDISPWHIYDEAGVLLLCEGMKVNSERVLESIIAHGQRPDLREAQASVELRNPFMKCRDIQGAMNNILWRFEAGSHSEETIPVVRHYVSQINAMCDKDPDAMIAVVHLQHERPYSINHSLNMAILASLLTRHIGIEQPDERTSIVAAALTCNIAMLHFQDLLEQQTTPLNDEQKENIRRHPEGAVKLLREFGLDDDIWLNAILYHHETISGEGYPNGVSGDAIPQSARILAIVDSYTALVTNRSYRKAKQPKDILRYFFMDKGKKLDEQLSQLFIKMMGIYPPGTYVRLENGEHGLVVHRAASGNSAMPTVLSYKGSTSGSFYNKTMERDTNNVLYRVKEIISHERLPWDFDVMWGYE